MNNEYFVGLYSGFIIGFIFSIIFLFGLAILIAAKKKDNDED